MFFAFSGLRWDKKVDLSPAAWLCSAGAESFHFCTVLRLKEGKNHIKYFSLRALEKAPTEKFNFIYEHAHFQKLEVLNCSELKCYNER